VTAAIVNTAAKTPPGGARRTKGERTRGRSARVCDAVLEAAAIELGRVGFSALRIEDVAARSKVNKTTVYRRWPTKFDLVSAVLERENAPIDDIDLGSLTKDVRACLEDLRTRLYTARQRGVMQVLLGERAHPQVAQLVREARERMLAGRRRVFERAIVRGELPDDADPSLLVEVMNAPLITRIMHSGEEVDDVYIDKLTQLLCKGAAALGR